MSLEHNAEIIEREEDKLKAILNFSEQSMPFLDFIR